MYTVEPAELLQYPEKVKSISKESRINLKLQSLYTLNYLGSGVSPNGSDLGLGENIFKKSGTCNSDKSDTICQGKTKYTYIRNIPTGTIPPLNLSFFEVTGCNLQGMTEGRGLIPGMIEDVYDMNPVEISLAATGNGNLGSDTCKEMTLPVGSRIYDTDSNDWKWETKCTAGHHSMTETTNARLNELIKNKNSHISNARLPGPFQLRENFVVESSFDIFDFFNNFSTFSFYIMILFLLLLLYRLYK
jgi:hypothetical protein